MNRRITYHARLPRSFIKCEKCGEKCYINKGKNPPIFTVGFEYDSDRKVLFISWAKPINGESYIKSFGIKTVNNRLDRMILNYPDVTYAKKMPKMISDNIDYYINLAKKYFKEIDDNNVIDYFI